MPSHAPAAPLVAEDTAKPLNSYQRRHNPNRKRRNTPPHRTPVLPTKVRVMWLEGAWCYKVSLHGRHGTGKWMIVDQDVWLEVVRLFGDVWNLKPNGRRNGLPALFQITTSRQAAIANTDRHWPGNTIHLARYIADATDTQRVFHRNRDFLDVRRNNLLVLDHASINQAA